MEYFLHFLFLINIPNKSFLNEISTIFIPLLRHTFSCDANVAKGIWNMNVLYVIPILMSCFSWVFFTKEFRMVFSVYCFYKIQEA